METTIFKTVKGSTMEAIFDNSETANIKYFKAIAAHDSGYDPEEKYKYEITIRHPENTDANVLFEEARFKAEILTPSPMTELNALENAVISAKLEGLKVYEKQTTDKRKTIKHYFLNYYGNTISPNLDYDNMNHFIMGLSKGLKLNKIS